MTFLQSSQAVGKTCKYLWSPEEPWIKLVCRLSWSAEQTGRLTRLDCMVEKQSYGCSSESWGWMAGILARKSDHWVYSWDGLVGQALQRRSPYTLQSLRIRVVSCRLHLMISDFVHSVQVAVLAWPSATSLSWKHCRWEGGWSTEQSGRSSCQAHTVRR